MSPAAPSRALFFCAGLARVHSKPVRETELRERGAKCKCAKVARAELAEPFFVPIVPLVGEFVPNARGDSTCAAPAPCRITDVPGLKCRARNPEISRQTAPNCPHLSRSIVPKWPVGTGFAKLMQTKCVTIAVDSRICTIWNRARAVPIMISRCLHFRASNATCPDP